MAFLSESLRYIIAVFVILIIAGAGIEGWQLIDNGQEKIGLMVIFGGMFVSSVSFGSIALFFRMYDTMVAMNVTLSNIQSCLEWQIDVKESEMKARQKAKGKKV